AEGQRRYVESLSSYARQFLGIMNKPSVEYIEGLSPSISIDQKHVSHNPRSTVGTITEIYDYLRLLFAKIGHPFCPECGREITKLSLDEITDRMTKLIERMAKVYKTKPFSFLVTAPVVRQRKGEFTDLFSNLQAKGYSEVIVDNKQLLTEDRVRLIKTNKHDIDVVVDNFSLIYKQLKDRTFRANLRSRIFHAVEQTVNLTDGLVHLVPKTGNKQLFSQKYSCSKCDISLPEIEPRMFSFNSPLGACEECRGIGTIITVDPKLVISPNLSINEGGILPFARLVHQDTWFARVFNTYLVNNNIEPDIPLGELTQDKLDNLLYGSSTRFQVRGRNRFGRETSIYEHFRGVVGELSARHTETDSDHVRQEIQKYMNENICKACSGKRLKQEVLNVKIKGLNIYDLCELSINDACEFVRVLAGKVSQYEKQVSSLIIREVKTRLMFLSNVGLGYLNLNRRAGTLSGGESQRIRLASQIGSGLSGVVYVLDEPSIGLHSRDIRALISSLLKLRDLDNTIIVVEHDIETIYAADHVVDFGPKAGKYGGKIVFAGSPKKLKKSYTLTGEYMRKVRKIPLSNSSENYPSSFIHLKGASLHNLKNIDVKIPLGKLTCVTGVSGSGKSSLVVDTLYPALKYYLQGSVKRSIGTFDTLEGYQYVDKVYLVDQSSIGRTPRSNPATYTGMFDFIRELFAQSTDARLRGYKKGRFSFNVRGGRCEKCSGAGTIKIEMQFLSDVYVTCDVCGGRRYNSETLEVKFKGKTIYDILQMTVDEAAAFFASHAQISTKLNTLQEVGLSYLELGRPAPTLSGGEAQRIKLAEELSKRGTGRTIYILDEPTTGLHMYDIENLIGVLQKLRSKGNTIVIIEHNLDIIAQSDYVIDLGPEGGDAGGSVVFQGSTSEIVKNKSSYTAEYLKKYLV
ncbi:MAG: excinuclease ABC subunit UvrA, partial [Candidatus Paceibacterota bacterium]